jgi:hypothetical protein
MGVAKANIVSEEQNGASKALFMAIHDLLSLYLA